MRELNLFINLVHTYNARQAQVKRRSVSEKAILEAFDYNKVGQLLSLAGVAGVYNLFPTFQVRLMGFSFYSLRK